MCDNIIDWICDFLTARKYRVKVNCSYSDWDDVTSGIPQGSVLGLFLIYINDLIDTCSTYSEVYVFADDAKFFDTFYQLLIVNNLQYAVDTLQKWSRKWLLNLNIKKKLFPMGDALRNYTPIVFVTVVIIWFLYKDKMKC